MDDGVGRTEELSLRVSVATLARVVFEHPNGGGAMLVLERKATLRENDGQSSVTVQAQPLGGACRLNHPRVLRELVDFHFDSERSRAEQDFRVQIRPCDWDTVRAFCLSRFQDGDETVVESDPRRELAEEFADALRVNLMPAQYRLRPVGAVIENAPASTDNIHAAGRPTVRLYNVFEVQILDQGLMAAILTNSERCSDRDLRELALEDARRGGKGRANGLLALPLDVLTGAYLALPADRRNAAIRFQGHRIHGNVPAVLEGVFIPKYQRLYGEHGVF